MLPARERIGREARHVCNREDANVPPVYRRGEQQSPRHTAYDRQQTLERSESVLVVSIA